MTTYFRWDVDSEKYASVIGVSEADREASTPQYFTGRNPTKVEFKIVEDPRGAFPVADCVNQTLPQPRILSERAKTVLAKFLDQSGRYISASIDGISSRYWIWVPLTVADCLDEQSSIIFETFSSYRRVVNAVFLKSRLPKEKVFTLKGFESQSIWVSSDFKRVVRSEGLSGFLFSNRARVE